ncbi:hypothetical protein BJV82DRAFT_625815 [Fennellomyces sp. T-0311]|nr:hypothetical protein BJV82DRAFT_625815 [Fennellomyces sp. T-0311]
MMHNFISLSLYYLLVTGVPWLTRASPIDETTHTSHPPSYSVQPNDAVDDVCPFYMSRGSSLLADAFDRFHGLFYKDLSTSFVKYSGPAGSSLEDTGFADSDAQSTRQDLLVASEYLAKLQPDFRFDADGAVTAITSTDHTKYHVFTLDTCSSTSFFTASDMCASLSSSHLSDPSGMLFRGISWSGIDTSQLDDRRTIVINIPIRSKTRLSIFTSAASERIADCHTVLNFFAVDESGDYDTSEASFTVIRDGYDSFEGFILAPNGYIEDISSTEYISGKVFAMQLTGIREFGEFSCGEYQGCFPVREHLEIMSPRAVEDEVSPADPGISTSTVSTVGPSTLSPTDPTSVRTSTITGPSTLSPTDPTSISTSTLSSSSLESSTTDEPSTSESSTDESSTDESSTDESSTDESSTDESSTDESSSSSEEPTSDTSSSTESSTSSSSFEPSSSITTDESTTTTCSPETTTETDSRTTTTTTGTLTKTNTTTKTATRERTVGTASITITESETITMTATATNTFTSIDSTKVTSTTIHTTSKPTVWIPVQNQWPPDVDDDWDDEY